jgi:hypothetical protein
MLFIHLLLLYHIYNIFIIINRYACIDEILDIQPIKQENNSNSNRNYTFDLVQIANILITSFIQQLKFDAIELIDKYGNDNNKILLSDELREFILIYIKESPASSIYITNNNNNNNNNSTSYGEESKSMNNINNNSNSINNHLENMKLFYNIDFPLQFNSNIELYVSNILSF